MITIREFADLYKVNYRAVCNWFGVIRKDIAPVHWKHEGKPPRYSFDDVFAEELKKKLNISENNTDKGSTTNTNIYKKIDEQLQELVTADLQDRETRTDNQFIEETDSDIAREQQQIAQLEHIEEQQNASEDLVQNQQDMQIRECEPVDWEKMYMDLQEKYKKLQEDLEDAKEGEMYWYKEYKDTTKKDYWHGKYEEEKLIVEKCEYSLHEKTDRIYELKSYIDDLKSQNSTLSQMLQHEQALQAGLIYLNCNDDDNHDDIQRISNTTESDTEIISKNNSNKESGIKNIFADIFNVFLKSSSRKSEKSNVFDTESSLAPDGYKNTPPDF